MSKKEKFIAETTPRYTAKGHFFTLGKGILDGEVIPEVDVNIPLRTINRHGLIAGAQEKPKHYKPSWSSSPTMA